MSTKAGRLALVISAGAAVAIVAGAAAELTGHRSGFPADGRDWLLALICVPLGARIAGHAPRNACGWLLLAAGTSAAGTIGASIWAGGAAGWLRDWLWWPSLGLLVLATLLFPDGRPVTARWRWPAGLLVASVVAGAVALAAMSLRAPGFLFGATAPERRPGWESVTLGAAIVALLAGAVFAVVALLARIRRTPAIEHGPLLWAVGNAALLVVTLALDMVESVPLAWLGVTLALPVAATVGVLRYGLYDIGLLVHRSLLYGLLTAGALGVYAAAVALAVRLVPSIAAPVAAGVTVVALLPLRQAVQSLLERSLFGQRGRPYHLVTTLNREINLADTPDRVLGAAVAALGAGLKLPYVSIQLDDRSRPETAHGRRRSWPVTTLPLSYRGRAIGHLDVQQRAADEPWSRREHQLLTDLAGQLGPPAAAVLLSHDLQDARDGLVRAREEELRRLQRELHDGIGPALSGARMLARAAAGTDRSGAGVLGTLESDLADASVELRRIIDGLRPPALDRGLLAALDALRQRHRTNGLTTTLSVTGELSGLPAAVEVAAYRVIDEALTNVDRHAHATTARITVARQDDRFHLTVDDDGVGGVVPRAGGVGLASMRERCQELGGDLEVLALPRGTRISATIPLTG